MRRCAQAGVTARLGAQLHDAVRAIILAYYEELTFNGIHTTKN